MGGKPDTKLPKGKPLMPSYIPTEIAGLPATEQEIVLSLDPDLLPLALAHRAMVQQAGIPYKFISGLRSRSFQQVLYDAALTDPAKFAAEPGNSKHEIGYAWDATGPRTNAEWLVFGRAAESLGLRWGGTFKDEQGRLMLSERPHVERPEPRSTLAVVRAVKLASVAAILGATAYVAVKHGD